MENKYENYSQEEAMDLIINDIFFEDLTKENIVELIKIICKDNNFLKKVFTNVRIKDIIILN